MALDTRFVLAYWASDYFVDKDTGLPLQNGVVTFYRDSNRTQLKNIYTLSGVPPYNINSYVALPNPMTLSASGNPQDFDGNNVDIYFFPYEDNPQDANNTVDLYYITVTDQNGVPQFTRNAIPNLDDTVNPSNGEVLFNYVPNGQFLTHNSGKSNGSDADGKIKQLITTIAPGGWTFERPTNNATDKVTFYRFGVPLSGVPSGNPRYGVQVECVTPSPSDSFKHLRLRFDNVNRFASDVNQITFAFTGQSLGSDFDVSLYLIRNNGTGGSAAPPWQFISTFTITNSFEIFQIPFIPGLNTGATIGANDDDYIQFAIAYPTGAASNSIFTDFIITDGNVNIEAFPEQTNAEFLSGTLPGYQTPDYDGYDIGLPVRLTKNGYEADHSFVGKISALGYDTSKLDWAEALCDGSGLIYADYNSNGVPYARLGDKIWDDTNKTYLFGSSPSFVTSNLATTVTSFTIATNTAGAQTAPANGTTAFTFTTVGAGATTYGVTGYHNWQLTSTVATIICNTVGQVNAYAADVTTGCTIRQIRSEDNAYAIFTVDTNTSTIVGGEKFTFSNPSTDFYVWFKVGGVGADPGGPGTGILVNLPAAPSKADIAAAIVGVLSGYTYSSCAVTTPPTAGQYFTFSANSVNYVAYYIVNNSGTAPVIANTTTIPISLPASPTATQTAAATYAALNKYSYAVPDLRGMNLRGLDSTGIWDVGYLTRLSKSPRGTNSLIGSIELDNILKHEHEILYGINPGSDEIGIYTNFGGGNATGVSDLNRTNGPPHYLPTGYMTSISPTLLTADALTPTQLDTLTINGGETTGANMAFHWSIHL